MNIFKHRHYKYDIIIWAVRWYCKYGISYRDLEEMLKERGVEVDHSALLQKQRKATMNVVICDSSTFKYHRHGGGQKGGSNPKEEASPA